MRRKRKSELSAELQDLLDNPVELENPMGILEIQKWNEFVPRFLSEKFVEQLELKPRLIELAGAALYGGVNPREVPIGDLLFLSRNRLVDSEIEKKYNQRITGPLTAIRAYCMQCMGGEMSAVRTCTAMACEFWPFRMGSNPFYGKIDNAEAESTEDEEEESTDAN